MAIKYGQTIEWTDYNGTKSSVYVDDYDTKQESVEAAIKSAQFLGWTCAKWWQWWRWNDTRPPETATPPAGK